MGVRMYTEFAGVLEMELRVSVFTVGTFIHWAILLPTSSVAQIGSVSTSQKLGLQVRCHLSLLSLVSLSSSLSTAELSLEVEF